MILDIETEAEEDVVPQEHLHLGVLSGVNRHDVTVDNRHGATGRRDDEVTVHLQGKKSVKIPRFY